MKDALPTHLQKLGCEPRVTGDKLIALCPLHEDARPSLRATQHGDAWLWHCPVCAKGGTIIDLHAMIHGVSIRDAISMLRQDYGNPAELPVRPAIPPRPPEPWPNIGLADGGTLTRLAKLRGLSVQAMANAQLYGYLRFGWRYGHQCYVLLDERESFAQYRRMDGGMFHHGQKSDNLARRKTRPIGLRHLGGKEVPVFLTEGTVGYLELLELLHRADMSHCTAALTLPSAASSIPSDVLPTLAGRRVRIIGDTGRAGEQAASRWVRELQSVGANVDCVDLSRVPELVRVPKADLGDLLKLPQTPNVLQTITAITSL